MKGFLVKILAISIFTSFVIKENKTPLKDKLLGKWIYQYSWVGNKKMFYQKNNLKPINSIEFLKCNDIIELEKFPIIVQNIRKRNQLKNIKSRICFLNGQKTETYPTLLHSTNGKYSIWYYGRKFKGGYRIDSLNINKMVINDGQKNILHVYYKTE